MNEPKKIIIKNIFSIPILSKASPINPSYAVVKFISDNITIDKTNSPFFMIKKRRLGFYSLLSAASPTTALKLVAHFIRKIYLLIVRKPTLEMDLD